MGRRRTPFPWLDLFEELKTVIRGFSTHVSLCMLAMTCRSERRAAQPEARTGLVWELLWEGDPHWILRRLLSGPDPYHFPAQVRHNLLHVAIEAGHPDLVQWMLDDPHKRWYACNVCMAGLIRHEAYDDNFMRPLFRVEMEKLSSRDAWALTQINLMTMHIIRASLREKEEV